jgi:hypothetical protein
MAGFDAKPRARGLGPGRYRLFVNEYRLVPPNQNEQLHRQMRNPDIWPGMAQALEIAMTSAQASTNWR